LRLGVQGARFKVYGLRLQHSLATRAVGALSGRQLDSTTPGPELSEKCSSKSGSAELPSRRWSGPITFRKVVWKKNPSGRRFGRIAFWEVAQAN
jgi:hypothetical protein